LFLFFATRGGKEKKSGSFEFELRGGIKRGAALIRARDSAKERRVTSKTDYAGKTWGKPQPFGSSKDWKQIGGNPELVLKGNHLFFNRHGAQTGQKTHGIRGSGPRGANANRLALVVCGQNQYFWPHLPKVDFGKPRRAPGSIGFRKDKKQKQGDPKPGSYRISKKKKQGAPKKKMLLICALPPRFKKGRPKLTGEKGGNKKQKKKTDEREGAKLTKIKKAPKLARWGKAKGGMGRGVEGCGWKGIRRVGGAWMFFEGRGRKQEK